MPDATLLLSEIGNNLENLAVQIQQQVGDDRTYGEIWGWNQPAINRNDLASLVRKPQSLIQKMSTDDKQVSDAVLAIITPLPARIAWIITNALPNMTGGNAFHCYLVISSLIEMIVDVFETISPKNMDFKDIEKRQLLPAAQIKRLKSVERSIDSIFNSKTTLEEKIKSIEDAHSTAESLPADLKMLEEARSSIRDTLNASQISAAGAENAKTKSEKTLAAIEQAQDQSSKMVAAIEGALGAATTKGLGEEFGKRAETLSKSVLWLFIALAVTLSVGALITYFRISHINEIITDTHYSASLLWAHVVLSFVSIAAPVWFAWLLTKQIGQRFRLSEDYAFKASIAKAYAGYSQEAARVDPQFQKALYETALKRIDEEPLRHVEQDSHGSPFHELLGNRRVQKALLAALTNPHADTAKLVKTLLEPTPVPKE